MSTVKKPKRLRASWGFHLAKWQIASLLHFKRCGNVSTFPMTISSAPPNKDTLREFRKCGDAHAPTMTSISARTKDGIALSMKRSGRKDNWLMEIVRIAAEKWIASKRKVTFFVFPATNDRC